MTVEFRDLTRVIGSEVIGVNMTRPLSQHDFQAIRDRWLERTILLFRGQETATPDDQLGLTRRFGELELHTLPQFTLPTHPEVFVVSNILKDGKPIGALRAGAHWHSDSQFLPIPSSGSLLLAREVPEEGGDTLFANLCAAYDDLPRKMKERIDGLKILTSRVKAWPISYPHRPPLSAEQKAKLPDVVHPLVRKHPDSGRKVLYIGGNVVWEIVGMGFEEGRQLLNELRAHATQPEYVYRHRWRVGDAILWDNRCTLHCATDYDEQKYRRLMHRTTIVGTIPL